MAAHASNTKRIWVVFTILSVITLIEVVLGIIKPDVLFFNEILSLSILNWMFIILTLAKAYYIMWAFMHLEGEKGSLRWSIVATMVFMMAYIACLLLIEGNYIYDVYENTSIRWIF